MAPTTPTGSRRTIVAPEALGRTSSRAIALTSSAYICSSPAGAAPLKADDSPIGMPFSWLTSLLVPSARAAERGGELVHVLRALGGGRPAPGAVVQGAGGRP